MVSIWALKRTLAGSIDTNFNPPQFSLDSTFKDLWRIRLSHHCMIRSSPPPPLPSVSSTGHTQEDWERKTTLLTERGEGLYREEPKLTMATKSSFLKTIQYSLSSHRPQTKNRRVSYFVCLPESFAVSLPLEDRAHEQLQGAPVQLRPKESSSVRTDSGRGVIIFIQETTSPRIRWSTREVNY